MKKILIIFFSVIFSIALIELILNLFWHPPYLNKLYKRDDIGWMSKNVVLNRYGYRDDMEMDIKKEKNVYRFYFLGDSYTYGWYINDVNNSYPNLFEKKLKEVYPQKNVEVINAARPGFDLNAEVQRLVNEGVAFKPDVIFFGINIDDLVDKEFPPRFSKNKFIRNLKIYQFTIGNYKRIKSAQKNEQATIESMTDGSTSNTSAIKNFESVDKLSKKIGAKVVLVIFPRFNPINPNEKYRYDFYHDFYKKIGEKYSFQIVDLLEPYSKISDKTELVLNPTDPHPTIQANNVAANFLFEKLDWNNIFSIGPTQQKSITKEIKENEKIGDGIRIIDIGSGWSIKQTENNIPVQSIFLNPVEEKQISYYEDKMVDIDKIEKFIKGGKDIVMSNKIYGFYVDGIKNVTGYWRDEGPLNSMDLPISTLNIQKKDDNILFSNSLPKNFEMYKIVFLVKTNKVEIVDGEVINIDQSDGSLPNITYIEI